MPRFAVLEHDHPHLHWDLLLEFDESCRTWRLDAPPDSATNHTESISAEPIPNHRLMYLDYEGPVKGRGHVIRWDSGEFILHEVQSSELDITFVGSRLKGRFRISELPNGSWKFDSNPIQIR